MSNQRNYVTIVSGLPRSGTSMMMQMIDAGGIKALTDEIRVADEDNPKGYYEFEPVKKTKEDPSWIPGASGKVVKLVHLLLLDLPLTHQYRVVFMRRRLEEVVKSQNIMLQRKGKNTDDLPKERLFDVFQLQLKQVTTYLESHMENFRFLEIHYNEILSNPAPSIERISTFLDGLDTEAMGRVVEPTLYRNRS